jgi:hypothetical protein
MKKLKDRFFCVILLIIFLCSLLYGRKPLPSVTFADNTGIRNSILNKVQVVKEKIRKMNVREIKRMWEEHILKFREGEDCYIDQKWICDTLLKYLDASYVKIDYEAKYFLDSLGAKAIAIFGTQKASYLLTGLGLTYTEYLMISEGASVRCNCSVESDWCSYGRSCIRDSSCISTDSSGCGTLWRYKCNGLCK